MYHCVKLFWDKNGKKHIILKWTIWLIWPCEQKECSGKVLGIDAYVYAFNKISFEIYVFGVEPCININISL